MNVSVRLFADFKQYSPQRSEEIELALSPGQNVAQVLVELNIPPQKPKVVLLNGRPAQDDDSLREGDKLVIFPPVEGG